MARKKEDPLKGLSQAEIDTVMAKRPKDMDEREIRIYKKVKYNEWIARGKKRAPKKASSAAAPTMSVSVPPPPIGFIKNAAVKVEPTKVTKLPAGSGKIPRWVTVPELTDKMKEWTNNRQILVTFDGKIQTCNLHWVEGEENPTVSRDGVEDFHFTWPTAYCAVKYAFIRDHKRDGLKKETAVAAVA